MERLEKVKRYLESEDFDEASPLPIPFKVFGGFCIVCAVVFAFGLAYDVSYVMSRFRSGALGAEGVSAVVVTFLHLGVLLALMLSTVLLGIRLLTDNRAYAARAAG
ncbi:MAG: hypothetical protein IKL97_00940, partial [Eggerthellaceae bacterium]|nr:hypothetical protein [Eggerthellaceae bacterium]